MIWWILGVPVALVILLAGILLFSSFSFSAARQKDDGPLTIRLRLCWIHPRLADFQLLLPDGGARLVLLSRFHLLKPDSDEPPDGDEEPPNVSPPAEPYHSRPPHPSAEVPDNADATNERVVEPPGGTGAASPEEETTVREVEPSKDNSGIAQSPWPGEGEEEARPGHDQEAEEQPSADEETESAGYGGATVWKEEPRAGRSGGYDSLPRAEHRVPVDGLPPSHEEPESTATESLTEEPASSKKRKKSLLRRIREHKITFLLGQRHWIGKLLRWLVRVLRTLLRLVVLERLWVGLRAATGDPAITGMLSGCVSGIRYALPSRGRHTYRLDFEPLFDQKMQIEWDGSIQIRTSVARLLWPLLVALLTFPYLSSFMVWRRLKRFQRDVAEDK